MKPTLFFSLILFISCSQKPSKISQDQNDSIVVKKKNLIDKKSEVDTLSLVKEEKNYEVDKEQIIGNWINTECKLSFEISLKNNQLFYKFQSPKRTHSDSLDIIYNSKNKPFFRFKNFEWHANEGELGLEYGDDIPDSLIQEKEPLPLPTETEAFYDPVKENFVIQNYGNSMTYFVKIAEGCNKYLFFQHENSTTIDTAQVISTYLIASSSSYKLMYWTKGDLNKDGFDDFIAVLENTVSNEALTPIEDAFDREVVLLETRGGFPYFRFAGRNNHLVGCSDCGGAGVGDPFQGITIKNGYFSIEELYGACDKSFVVTTFKYDEDKKDYFLYKIGTDDYSCNDMGNDEVKVHHSLKTQKDFGIVKFRDFK